MVEALRKASPQTRFIFGAGSFFATFAFYWFFLGFPLAAALTLSFLIHELCHLIAFQHYGIKSAMVFVVLGAVTYTISEEDAQKPASAIFWVVPAGIIGNLAIGAAMFWLGSIDPSRYIVALLNFYLAFLNLGPRIFSSDGGKMVGAITYFFKEKQSPLANWIIITAEMVAIFGFTQLVDPVNAGGLMPLVVILLFGMDLIMRLSRYQPRYIKPHPQGFTEGQAVRWATLYGALVVLSLAGLILLPPTPIF